MDQLHNRRSSLGLFGIALTTLVLFSCSQKIVNDDVVPSISLSMKVTEPAFIELINQFQVIVTAPDMDSIVAPLVLKGTIIEGKIDVPAGNNRKFVVQALDTVGLVIYAGSTVVNIESGVERSLTINLYPQVSLIKFTPRFQTVGANVPFAVDVKVFNIDSLYSISFRVYYIYPVWPDSARVGRNLDSNVIFFNRIDNLTQSYAIAVSQTDQTTPIVNANGYATLATVYFTSGYPEIGTDTAELLIEVTEMRKPTGNFIPISSVYTDRGLVEVNQAANPVVTFPDSMLEYAVRQAVGKNVGPLYLSEVQTIDTLYADTLGISDLTGLSNLTNLVFLYLLTNQISDLSPLAGMTSIQWLGLGSNQIINISPLSGLTNLQWLLLFENQISDISPLSALTNLQGVGLWSNPISDISPLSGLTNLTSLLLGDNQIIDISPLSGLTNIQSLSLWANQIADISPLSSLTNLQFLFLDSNQITNITPLAGLTNIWYLSLDYNQVIDISPLDSLMNIQVLSLELNQITNINPLVLNQGLDSGDVVWLTGNPLDSISINSYIPALQRRGVTVHFIFFRASFPYLEPPMITRSERMRNLLLDFN